MTASKRWGGRPLRQRIRAALPHSYGALLHSTTKLLQEKDPDAIGFAVVLRRNDDQPTSAEAVDAMSELMPPRLQRAIGVQYRRDTERASHYFSACLPLQFDA